MRFFKGQAKTVIVSMSKRTVDGNCMKPTNKAALCWLAIGAVLSAVGVALGAYGAHGLQNLIEGRVEDVEKSLEYWATANRYMMYHCFAIMAVSITSLSTGLRRSFSVCNCLFVIGIALFSGCLYVMALTDIKKLGAVVPIGGLSLIVAWINYSVGLFYSMKENQTHEQQ